jgi:hypothetical protein
MNAHAFDELGRFVIRDYAETPPFASFLPGIAGPMGIPLWVFYVNRGQAIAAFGIESKDAPITEFLPANKAYQRVSYTGFRTFIKIGGAVYEPFAPNGRTQLRRQMFIGTNELELQETAPEHGLQVNVLYFTLTGEPFAGLVRQVTITNLSSDSIELAVLDGLPVIIPFGLNNDLLKNLARTAEAWMGVLNLEQDIPFYRLRSSMVDKVEVEGYEAGHFYTTFTDRRRLPAIVDPALVFGQNTALSVPDAFVKSSLADLFPSGQVTVGKTPCGFFGTTETVPGGGVLTLYGIVGHASSLDMVRREAGRFSHPAYIQEQRRAANVLVQTLTDVVAVKTGEPLFDAYTRQTFLDNVLRGGWPVLLGDPETPIVQHIYSRKHGDLERDYNAFYLAPEFYSQGNGNYRDVNQNRREDVWLNPRVRDYNIVTFMNLIQADGYNPLVIHGNRFTIPPENLDDVWSLVENPAGFESFLASPFTPGALLKHIAVTGIALRVPPDDFLNRVLRRARHNFEAVFGEGYWIDHWTYNLDLIENYLSIYPEKKTDLLFDRRNLTFYDSAVIVNPRSEKYILTHGRVRQLHAIRRDPEKAALIESRAECPHVMRAAHGHGEIFYTTLFEKLVCLALIKFATMDPFGMGIEMEAERPGWYDALNGLPGLFGSSLPETFELARLLAFLRDALAEPGVPPNIVLPVEVYDLLQAVLNALDEYTAANVDDRDQRYWDAAATAREIYRARIRLGFDGETQPVALSRLDRGLARSQKKIQAGIDRAQEMNNGLPPTYFVYHPLDYEIIGDGAGENCPVQIKRFSPEVLPLFLEGPVRALKITTDHDRARQLHEHVRASDLFDRELKMYKVNASLAGQPPDIGRARAFPPGWLENESIWLHMEYKYLLALLKAGLVEEFYEDFRHVLVPFLDPAQYGRSPLENSSFIASSAHPDRAVHGRGFVARLSGSTVEFLSILHRIMAGEQPFFVQAGQLCLAFEPALPGWLFDEHDQISFTFLGSTTVVYHNPARRDTFGEQAAIPVRFALEMADGTTLDIEGGHLGAPYAEMVRDGAVKIVHITLTPEFGANLNQSPLS